MEKASSCGAEETAQRSSGETGLCLLQYGPKDFLLWPVNRTINMFRCLPYYDDFMVMKYNSDQYETWMRLQSDLGILRLEILETTEKK